jgi:hypothetical protein
MKLGSNLPADSMGAVFVVVLTLAVGGMVFTAHEKNPPLSVRQRG